MTKTFDPIFISGKVVKGFGRGSKQLGIPTANVDTSVVQNIGLENGIYYGFCQIVSQKSNPISSTPSMNSSNGLGSNGTIGTSESDDKSSIPTIYQMVCSLGFNPHFDNTIRSLEVHLIHHFDEDFYGSELRVSICGYIRTEQKFDSLEELIETIHNDIDVAKEQLKNLQVWTHVTENEFFQQ